MKIYIQGEALPQWFGIVKARILEGINIVTTIDLELATQTELPPDDLEGLMGAPVTFFVEDEIDDVFHKSRWDGNIFEIMDVSGGKDDNGIYYYAMVIRPGLWKLNYFVHSRSYIDKSRVDVIDELMKEHSFTKNEHYTKNYKNEAVYPALNNILQQGTSDLSFFQSLMNNAGINYYFAADEDAEKIEQLHIVDDNVFFKKVPDTIPIIEPGGILQQRRRVEYIARMTRAIPGVVKSTAFLGDGSTQTKMSEETHEKTGSEGQVHLYVPEGSLDTEGVAKQSGKVISQGFVTNRVVYRGIADHIRIRPGFKIALKNYSTADEYSVLVFNVHHTFEQTVNAALAEHGSRDASYTNHFMAFEPNANVRPEETTEIELDISIDGGIDLNLEGKLSINPKFKFSPQFKFNPTFKPEINVKGIGVLMGAVATLQAQILALNAKIKGLNKVTGQGYGLVAAEVTQDTWVTDGKEHVCKVKCSLFEEPITVKVASAWMSPGGGSATFPRVGVQVWIQKIQGAKSNDWVVVGFRPNSDMPGLDPAQSSETQRLATGEAPTLGAKAENVVSKSPFSPSNRQRNTLSGEGGVAEVAVIDGGDAAVSIHGNKDVYIVGDAETHIISGTHLHSSGSVNEQFGSVNRGVGGDQKESIGGNHEMTVIGDQTLDITGNVTSKVAGDTSDTVEGGATRNITGDSTSDVGGSDTQSVVGDTTHSIGGMLSTDAGSDILLNAGAAVTAASGADFSVDAGGNLTINAGGDADAAATNVNITGNAAVTVTGTSKIELVCGGSSIKIDPVGVTISGPKIDVSGQGIVTITGATVKIN